MVAVVPDMVAAGADMAVGAQVAPQVATAVVAAVDPLGGEAMGPHALDLACMTVGGPGQVPVAPRQGATAAVLQLGHLGAPMGAAGSALSRTQGTIQRFAITLGEVHT